MNGSVELLIFVQKLNELCVVKLDVLVIESLTQYLELALGQWKLIVVQNSPHSRKQHLTTLCDVFILKMWLQQ